MYLYASEIITFYYLLLAKYFNFYDFNRYLKLLEFERMNICSSWNNSNHYLGELSQNAKSHVPICFNHQYFHNTNKMLSQNILSNCRPVRSLGAFRFLSTNSSFMRDYKQESGYRSSLDHRGRISASNRPEGQFTTAEDDGETLILSCEQ